MGSVKRNRLELESVINRLIEFENEGTVDVDELARLLDVRPLAIRGWRKDPYYLSRLEDVRLKAEKKTERVVESNTRSIKLRLAEYCDAAIETVVQIMKDDKQPGRTRLIAAAEVLDRDGRFAKVSRLMNVTADDEGRPMVTDDVAKTLMAALQKTDMVQ